MTAKKEFAKGTIFDQGCVKIYYGESEKVKKKVKGEGMYWSINYYETRGEMEEKLKIDCKFLKDETGVNFVNVDEVLELPIARTS